MTEMPEVFTFLACEIGLFPRGKDCAAVVGAVITDAGLDVVKRDDTRQGRGPRLRPKESVAVQNDRSEAAALERQNATLLTGSEPCGAGNTAARASAIVSAAMAARRSTACKNGGANRR